MEVTNPNFSPHAIQRWQARFSPDLDEMRAALARSHLKIVYQGKNFHYYDPETSAEFVCRKSREGEWWVVTVMLFVNRKRKMNSNRQRRRYF